MKLRNKITKEIWNIPEWRTPAVQEGDISFFAELNGEGKLFSYKSLDDLNKEWEDYKPAEPLIKNEKIRKAVRAWAEANSITQVSHDTCWNAFRSTDFVIDFDYDFDRRDGLVDMKTYTIAELCGEEDE